LSTTKTHLNNTKDDKRWGTTKNKIVARNDKIVTNNSKVLKKAC
jgi:hypothetical protein